jgi:hypothetical protein
VTPAEIDELKEKSDDELWRIACPAYEALAAESRFYDMMVAAQFVLRGRYDRALARAED